MAPVTLAGLSPSSEKALMVSTRSTTLRMLCAAALALASAVSEGSMRPRPCAPIWSANSDTRMSPPVMPHSSMMPAFTAVWFAQLVSNETPSTLNMSVVLSSSFAILIEP
eukprot:1803429-Rhodomonas_salina.2